MKMTGIEAISRGVPRGYGLAYSDIYRDVQHVYPIPLNVAVRWARQLWLTLKLGGPQAPFERQLLAAYQAGFNEGLDQGRLEGRSPHGGHVRSKGYIQPKVLG